MADSKNIIWLAQINLCLQEIKVPEALLSATLKQMAEKMAMFDKDSEEFKELSYYAQILHGAIQSMEAALDVVSGLSLLMVKDFKF